MLLIVVKCDIPICECHNHFPKRTIIVKLCNKMCQGSFTCGTHRYTLSSFGSGPNTHSCGSSVVQAQSTSMLTPRRRARSNALAFAAGRPLTDMASITRLRFFIFSAVLFSNVPVSGGAAMSFSWVKHTRQAEPVMQHFVAAGWSA